MGVCDILLMAPISNGNVNDSPRKIVCFFFSPQTDHLGFAEELKFIVVYLMFSNMW